MTRAICLLIVVSMILLPAAQGVLREAAYECYTEDTYYEMFFSLTPNDEEVGAVYAMNLSTASPYAALLDECGSNTTIPVQFFNINATGNDEFTITIRIDKVDGSVDKDCGALKDPGVDPVYSWLFRTVRMTDIVIFSLDLQYSFTCNFSIAAPRMLSTGLITVTGTVTENPATEQTNVFALELVGAADNIPKTTVALADNVRLQITRVSGDSATGVSGYSCWAGPTLANFNAVELIDATGCTVATPAVLTSTAFVPFPAAVIADPLRTVTGAFEQFKFTNLNTIVYTCTVYTCFSDDNGKCDDLCASGGPAGRRKRAADDELQEEFTISAIITIGQYPNNGNSPEKKTRVDSSDKPVQEVPSCLNNSGIIAAFAVLGALLLITISVAVFVCFRSMRLMSESQRRDEKHKI